MTFPNVQYLDTSNSIVLSDLLTVFPYLRNVTTTGYLSKNWTADILQVKEHSLMSLSFCHFNLQDKRFDFNELLKVLKAQRPGFWLRISFIGPPGQFESQLPGLKQFLDQHLVRGGIPWTQKTCTHVSIQSETWHVP
uniref:RNA 2',3'-cyclic phosphodiesterase n=1 Tax=Panagrellus redivivus TaxID=6233 RepID=A0A7E4WBK8_PANRE